MRAVQATTLPNDYYASSLTHENLAPPRSVTIKINVDADEPKSPVDTTMESSKVNGQRKFVPGENFSVILK